MGKNNALWITAKAAITVFFLAFFFYPLLVVFLKALSFSGQQNTVQSLFSNTKLAWNSFVQAGISTFFCILIGFPAAFIAARKDFPGKKMLRALSLVPFVFPSILVVISFVIIFGNNGWINYLLKTIFSFSKPVQFLYGFWGIIMAHVFYNFPIVMRLVANAWENHDLSMKEAAKTLGAGKAQVFLKITLPQLIPAVLAAACLVFIYTFMSFAIVLSIGGINFTTLEVEIYHNISRSLNFGLGALLAIAQFFVLLIIATAYSFFSARFGAKEGCFSEKPKKISLKRAQGIAQAVFLALLVLFILLPVISLTAFAFFDQQTGAFSLKAFEKIIWAKPSLLGTTPLQSILLSLALACIASVAATTLGLIAALKQTKIPFIAQLLGASLAVSTITLAFGYYLAFGSANFIAIAAGHSLLAFPFAYRITSNALDKIDEKTIESARTLGASQLQVLLKIQIPKIKNALLASMAFCFAVSLGELGLVLVLYDGIYATMPVYIYRLLSTFDLFAATAMGLILISISFFSFYAIEFFSKDTRVI